MRWLRSILFKVRGFFDNQEAVEMISVDNLSAWLDQQSNFILENSGMYQEVQEFIQKLKEHRWMLECKMDDWEKMIPVLHEQRSEIINLLSECRKMLELITIPNDYSMRQIANLLSRLHHDIELLSKVLEQNIFFKNYEFLFTEQDKDPTHSRMNPLMEELISLNGLCDSFERRIAPTGLVKIQNLSGRINKLRHFNEQISSLRSGIVAKKERLKVSRIKSKEKEDHLGNLRKNQEYVDGIEVKKKKESVQADVQENKEAILDFFVDLKSLLEHYRDLHPDNSVVQDYVIDPLRAFSNDEGLAILHVLQHLQAALTAGKLPFSIKDMTDADEKLHSASNGYLEKLKQNQISLMQELESIRGSPRNMDYLLKVEEAQYRHEHFAKQVDSLQNQISQAQDEIQEYKEKARRERDLFQQLVRISLQREVTIIADTFDNSLSMQELQA